MKPPRPSGESGEVQRVIEQGYGDDISFKYPKTGKYRSSIIFHDINGDGQDEAIALFKTSNSERSICINVLISLEGTWFSVKDFTGEYDNVDRVYFEDIDGDGVDEIIIGWSDSSNTHQNHITVYDYIMGTRNFWDEINISESYMDMAIMDADEDNIKEIFIIQSQQNSDHNSSVKFLKINARDSYPKFKTFGEAKFETLDKIELDLLDLDNIHITEGLLDISKYGISIDSQFNHNQKTDIIYWDSVQKKLRDPIKERSSYINVNSSPSNIRIYPKDINGDGIIEFPSLSSLYSPKSKSTEVSTPYLLTWKNYNIDTGKFSSIKSLIYNDSEKYTLDAQDKWKGEDTDSYYSKISVLIDEENRTMTASTHEEGVTLFTITAFSEKEWQLKKNNKFVEIYKGDGLVYAITQIDLSSELSITEDEIINSFEKVNNDWEDI